MTPYYFCLGHIMYLYIEIMLPKPILLYNRNCSLKKQDTQQSGWEIGFTSFPQQAGREMAFNYQTDRRETITLLSCQITKAKIGVICLKVKHVAITLPLSCVTGNSLVCLEGCPLPAFLQWQHWSIIIQVYVTHPYVTLSSHNVTMVKAGKQGPASLKISVWSLSQETCHLESKTGYSNSIRPLNNSTQTAI